jgi:hypothetical protein
MAATRNGIKIFVASTVYDFQPQLDGVYEMLDSYGYEVLNSHKGTIFVDSSESNITNCLNAVKECDIFVGFIRPDYGSGVIGEKSITHMEFETAASLVIPRFVLADHRVVFARSILGKEAYIKTPTGNVPVNTSNMVYYKKHMDIRCIHLYEEAIKNGVVPKDRKGNWVQEFTDLPNIRLFLESQFKHPERIKQLIEKFKQLPP